MFRSHQLLNLGAVPTTAIARLHRHPRHLSPSPANLNFLTIPSPSSAFSPPPCPRCCDLSCQIQGQLPRITPAPRLYDLGNDKVREGGRERLRMGLRRDEQRWRWQSSTDANGDFPRDDDGGYDGVVVATGRVLDIG